jgi:hypothetical protein
LDDSIDNTFVSSVRRQVGCVHCFARSTGRPAVQEGIGALVALGFHKPGDVENRLGYYLGQIARQGRRATRFPTPTVGHSSRLLA